MNRALSRGAGNRNKSSAVFQRHWVVTVLNVPIHAAFGYRRNRNICYGCVTRIRALSILVYVLGVTVARTKRRNKRLCT